MSVKKVVPVSVYFLQPVAGSGELIPSHQLNQDPDRSRPWVGRGGAAELRLGNSTQLADSNSGFHAFQSGPCPTQPAFPPHWSRREGPGASQVRAAECDRVVSRECLDMEASADGKEGPTAGEALWRGGKR